MGEAANDVFNGDVTSGLFLDAPARHTCTADELCCAQQPSQDLRTGQDSRTELEFPGILAKINFSFLSSLTPVFDASLNTFLYVLHN